MQYLDWLIEDDGRLTVAAPAGQLYAAVDDQAGGRTTRDGIPLAQILSDRPDVFAAYFQAFHSANNDTHSSAWLQRVGGYGVEDYANYWYEQHGRWEGYGARDGGQTAGAPVDGDAMPLLPGIVETGRTTIDGIPLSQILTERPDVFRAFFTEFYGPNNDRNSPAWIERVGGDTVEDYANYWYETHGRWGDYVPRAPDAPPPSDLEGDANEDSGEAAPPIDGDALIDESILAVGRGLCDVQDVIPV